MSEELIKELPTFEAVTDEIRVAVQSYFLAAQSDPDNDQYFWAYRIKISNESDASVQLLSRHWIITDSNGKREEVIGDGVIGEQPRIPPGKHFTYTSGCPLDTASGFMHGTFDMLGGKNRLFTIAIPAFSLDSPYCSEIIN
ncbi:MAG: Co2+/Mg2+ efflux protein ApaG [Kordiimonadales bacterium]|nr:MAG: Co2+/Mg2+ efflux protein ApaG [Kordiimonadales bacterium]